MSAWRKRPPPTLQGPLTCWAAAISSFGRVTRGVPDWPAPEDVITHFESTFATELNSDGSLKTPRGWIAFAKAFDLKVEEIRIEHPIHGVFPATSGIASKVAKDLQLSHFATKLKSSHVITVIGTNDENGISHAVVVYGADNLRLCFMDPLSDPSNPLTDPRPPGGSGRVAENWFCETYGDFHPAPKYLLIWRG